MIPPPPPAQIALFCSWLHARHDTLLLMTAELHAQPVDSTRARSPSRSDIADQRGRGHEDDPGGASEDAAHAQGRGELASLHSFRNHFASPSVCPSGWLAGRPSVCPSGCLEWNPGQWNFGGQTFFFFFQHCFSIPLTFFFFSIATAVEHTWAFFFSPWKFSIWCASGGRARFRSAVYFFFDLRHALDVQALPVSGAGTAGLAMLSPYFLSFPPLPQNNTLYVRFDFVKS